MGSIQGTLIHLVVQTSGFLSVCGGFLIVVSLVIFRDMLKDSQTRQLLFLGISDFFLGVAYFMGNANAYGDFFCYLQSILITYFELANLFWICNIATGILVSLAKPRKRIKVFFEIYYHVFAWGLPLIVVLIFILFNVPGYESDLGGWCWISQTKFEGLERGLWKFSSFYAFLFCSFIYIIVIFIVIAIFVLLKNKNLKSKIDRATFNTIKKQNRIYVIKFFLYPVALLVCYFFALVNEIYSIFSSEDLLFLLILHSIFAHSIGLTNFIVYGVTQSVFKKYKEVFSKCCNRDNVDTRNALRSDVVDVAFDLEIDDDEEEMNEVELKNDFQSDNDEEIVNNNNAVINSGEIGVVDAPEEH